jgi:hypothetical protein
MLVQARLDRYTVHCLDGRVWTERRAHQLYARLCNQVRWGWLWSALTGRTRHLLDLASVEATCTVHDRRYTGLQMVPIDRIRGSESRSNEFDRDFCPLWNHTRERWLNIAVLRQQGKTLPPVELVQIGEVYFCIDGHHRISVARAMGEREIEAQVTVWQVTGGCLEQRGRQASALPLPR